MKKCSALLSLLLAGVIAAALPASSAVEEYDLDFEHFGTVGEIYAFTTSLSSSEKSKAYLDGELLEDELIESSVALEGQVEYLAVDEDGAILRMAYRLDSAEVEVEGDAVEVDRSRRLVLDLSGDTPQLTYEGGDAVDADLRELLLEALDQGSGSAEDSGDDDVLVAAMGLDTPRAPGTRWDIDYASFFAASGDGEAFSLEFDPELTRGQGHFERIDDTTYGEDVAFLVLEIESTGYAFSEGQIPDFLDTTESELQVVMAADLSMDSHSSVGRQAVGMTMHFVADGDMVEQGQTFHLAIEVEVETRQEMTLTRIE